MSVDSRIASEVSEVVRLTYQIKQLDAELRSLSKKLIEDMKYLQIKNIPFDSKYIVERCEYVRYKDPNPAQVRELLGDMSKNYIREYVVPQLKADLPPNLFAKLYKIIDKKEYIRVREI
jgi:hypothetical protein